MWGGPKVPKSTVLSGPRADLESCDSYGIFSPSYAGRVHGTACFPWVGGRVVVLERVFSRHALSVQVLPAEYDATNPGLSPSLSGCTGCTSSSSDHKQSALSGRQVTGHSKDA